MFAFLICMIGMAATGGATANAGLIGIPIIYYLLGTLFVSYIYILISKRERLPFGKLEKCLIAFEVWALLQVILSYLGLNRSFDLDLFYDNSFIPRQAVYLFVLPAVLLFREDLFNKGKDWLLKYYGEVLFWVLLIVHMIYQRQIIISIPGQILFCWLSLCINAKQAWRRWTRILVLMLLPMSDAGASTILLLRVLFLSICIMKESNRRILTKMVAVGLTFILICCLALPFALESEKIPDYNAAWRLRIWKEELTVLKNSSFLGVGYGTSYAGNAYIEDSFTRWEWQFAANSQYSQRERAFVTGPHNSFVSIAMRTGIIGITLFVLFLILLFKELMKYPGLPSKSSCFALFASVILISFNVGLESPGYLCIFVFMIGCCVQEVRRLRKVWTKDESIRHYGSIPEREDPERESGLVETIQ